MICSENTYHTVRTRHVQSLIANALLIAKAVDGELATVRLSGDDVGNTHESVCIPDALEKAVTDLRHAAAELEAERLSCFGWGQV